MKMVSGKLKDVLNYRGFILSSVRREFQSRYQNSVLGATWAVLNPLAMIVVYTVIFAQVMHSRLAGADSPFAYSIYLCAGVLTWGLFAEITTRAQVVFLENANLLKKVNFPRICLPVVVIFTALINFAIIFLVFTAFLVLSGNFPGLVYLALFPVLFVLIVFAIGLGVTLGVLHVFFRDVGQFFAIFLQFWFWLTPIVYPVDILPEHVRALLWLNHLTTLMAAFHNIFILNQPPHWGTLLFPLLIGALLCLLGLNLFRKHSGEMVDEL